MTNWHDRQPIFRQLADQITQQILQGIWQEGDALPLFVASLRIKLTTSPSKAINCLLMRGGWRKNAVKVCLSLSGGAKLKLLADEKARFLQQQIPQIAGTIQRLDMSLDEFIQQLKPHLKGDQ
ncbi:LOW QUALITY PROTEIN: transcriptional regulator, GntR family [Vibrio sp. JCM 18905]|nr:LOW QUALITY PROTEIN: transcriptional regulator, GntR family [Vibrio sp. JCM 18905]